MKQSLQREKLGVRYGVVLVMALLALMLAACGGGQPAAPAGGDEPTAEAGGEQQGGETTEASGEPIKVGAIFDQTGPTADVGNPYSQGIVAFVAWKNANGGINGRPIEMISSDYSYQVPRAEELYTQYVTQDQVVVFSGWGTGDTEALKGKISQDQIPFISASLSANLADPAETPYNFLVGTTYSDQLIIAQEWALEDWAAKGSSDAPKFAYMINDSPFGQSPVPDGTAHAEANGVEAPLEVPMPRGATDLTAQLTQIQDSGSNYVFFQNVSSPVALALQNAQALGMEDVQFVCMNWCANELLISLAGEAAESVVGAIPFDPVGSEGAAEALDYATANNIDIGGNAGPYVQGWWAMAILMEGVQRTLDNGEELTGENIKASLETLSGFDTKGVTAPVSFSETDHRATRSLRLFQVQDGKWAPITDFLSAE